jgi:hypothetical protein
MSDSTNCLYISEYHNRFLEKIRLRYYRLLGYKILLFCESGKKQKLSKHREDSCKGLSKHSFHAVFHGRAELINKLYKIIYSNDKKIVKDCVESEKSRILIRDLLMRSVNGFDELLYLVESNREKYTTIKLRCNWSLLRSQVVKHNVLTFDVDVSFSYLPLIFPNIIKVVQPLMSRVFSILIRKKESKILEKHPKEENKIIFFPHKGVAYGSNFEKNYYYDDSPLSPLNKNNILHLEYSNFDNSIAESYISQELKYKFIERPGLLHALKYLIKNLKSILFDIVNYKHSSFMSNLLSIYINTLASFLSEFYLHKISSIVECKFALIGYDVLLPKEISMALHRLNIKTIAIQERYTLPYAGNYNLIVDNYLVWSHNVEKMIGNSIGESYVGNYIVTGPPRSDKIDLYKKKSNQRLRKKIIVYSNAPEPEKIDKCTLLNSWINIKTLLQDVLELSVKFPECDFKIRAKHAGWDDIIFFRHILELLNCSNNVEIINDYQRMDISYELLSGVYGVIGHHTSISDEAMCHGIPVLFHDFNPYVSEIYKNNYSYNGLKLFSSNSKDFQLKFFNYFIKEQYPEDIKKYMCKNYKNLCNGGVMARVNNVLHKIIQPDA